jgi:hypothetical protein
MAEMLHPDYLSVRASSIRPDTCLRNVTAGQPSICRRHQTAPVW